MLMSATESSPVLPIQILFAPASTLVTTFSLNLLFSGHSGAAHKLKLPRKLRVVDTRLLSRSASMQLSKSDATAPIGGECKTEQAELFKCHWLGVRGGTDSPATWLRVLLEENESCSSGNIPLHIC